MASPIPFLDLNLLPDVPDPIFITPKIEPKLEPQEDLTPIFANPNPIPTPNPNPNPSSLQEISPSPTNTDLSSETSDVYSEFFRISELFRSAFADKIRRRYKDITVLQPDLLSIVPAPEEQSRAIVVAAKKKHRSNEMVRVSALSVQDQLYFRDLVRRTRMSYESLRMFLIQEDERSERCGLINKRSRSDLKAAAAMRDRDLWLNRDKRIIGPIPGIYVGDVFFFRMEMCVIGLHGQVQAGIDYVPANRNAHRDPIATSIIVSGGYEDDEDSGDVIIYTGHGGKERNIAKQCVHQKLEGGNLAMERSMYHGIEIRVIRGIKTDCTPTGRVYVYDGLYRILHYWLDVGKSGFCVYKYKLMRIEGQPEMGSVILKFAENMKKGRFSETPPGYLSLDISMGKENLPVLLFNDIDCDRGPMFFKYLVRPVYPPFVFQQPGNGCNCVSGCSDGCYCVEKNGGELPYDVNGVLLKGKPLLHECGSSCSCPPTCRNRVSQKGLKYQLEVFRSRETGWGVRSLDLIRAGTFICEYTGIVLTRQQADVVAMNGDNLVHPDRFPERWVEWGDLSSVFPQFVRPEFPSLPQLSFAMDVSTMRNAACYFSHSCSPNVMVQFVLYDHCTASYPHLMLFAMENIPPLRELSIDYGVTDVWMGKNSP